MWEQVNHVNNALNPQLAAEERINSITLLGRTRMQGALDAFLQLIEQENDLQIRLHAVQGITQLDKREAYPAMLNLLEHTHAEIRKQAIESSYALQDSRLLFPLVNLYQRLGTGTEEDTLTRYAIVRTLKETVDPRAASFVENLCASSDTALARLAAEARDQCSGSAHMQYTFGGADETYRTALSGQRFHGKMLYHRDNLRDAGLQQFLSEARKQDGLCYATYIVLPADEQNPFLESGTYHLTLAPRESEHVVAALGKDVLAAGQVGLDLETLTVQHLDNHSGGYLPDETSFVWVQKALASAHIPCPLRAFSTLYPHNGYFTEEFLSQQPLYRTSST